MTDEQLLTNAMSFTMTKVFEELDEDSQRIVAMLMERLREHAKV